MGTIVENLQRVKQRMEAAALRVGRAPEEISLVAVTKTVPIPRIREAIDAGITLFGENRVQEAREKVALLGRSRIRWHLIGHLQRNKVKYVFDLFDLIHSVDSLALAQEINKQGSKRNQVMPIFLQVNVAGEATKFGVSPEEALPLLKEMARLPYVAVRGLMTIPPLAEDAEASRPYFRELRLLRDEIAKVGIEGISLAELSMGMSNDYEVAIEEGATFVRIGSALFGPRST
ncbi:MAG: YggS family pyridoxal phosphate-dependent enzyme [Nitrospinota bacterium]|nr:MAG: YggS family pyridoxal phosphate-dependent enzyme [Nitrospinota bacterium]